MHAIATFGMPPRHKTRLYPAAFTARAIPLYCQYTNLPCTFDSADVKWNIWSIPIMRIMGMQKTALMPVTRYCLPSIPLQSAVYPPLIASAAPATASFSPFIQRDQIPWADRGWQTGTHLCPAHCGFVENRECCLISDCKVILVTIGGMPAARLFCAATFSVPPPVE